MLKAMNILLIKLWMPEGRHKMRANYKTLCIRFRTDSENHMEAYELLNSMKNSGNSYADVITDIITKQEEVITKECLKESEKVSSIPMKELEQCLVKATENICGHIDEALGKCSIRALQDNSETVDTVMPATEHKEAPSGVMSFMLGGICDDDE